MIKRQPKPHQRVFKDKTVSFSDCAVVGNSGVLSGSKNGEDIDRHECVVRMNAAEVKGHEEDVGSKTTFRLVNGLLQQGKTLNYTSTPSKWLEKIRNRNLIFVPVNERSLNIARNLTHDSNTIYELTEEFKDYISKDVKRKLNRHPSTGMFACLLFSCLCEHITLYGFGFHQEDVENRHYWEQWSDHHDGSHTWNKEKEIVHRFCESDQFDIVT